ncbi:tetraprenyl-beta-curcumene synthase family protein [Paenibacillus tarimensis]
MIMERRAPRSPLRLMYRVYKYVLPEVDAELTRWREIASAIPDEELRTQALASMDSKRFHCEGGAVYAAAHLEQRHVLIPLIVALQTISDYLDNLCDRSTSLDPDDFRLLHQSMLDAVNPTAKLKDYYALRSESEDGGYLSGLVRTCQSCVAMLPAYGNVQRRVSELVGLYCDLQVNKHIRKDLREPRLLDWWESNRHRCPHLLWNEFAAATGSTLGMFMLFLAATHPGLNERDADAICDAYFPHVCGLHILLDYLIDQQEDREGGDLNFCSYYENQAFLIDRISGIVTNARQDVLRLPASRFHRMIIEGLLALYLSDPKVRTQRDVKDISRRLMKRSPMTRMFFWMNSLWIRTKQSRLAK